MARGAGAPAGYGHGVKSLTPIDQATSASVFTIESVRMIGMPW